MRPAVVPPMVISKKQTGLDLFSIVCEGGRRRMYGTEVRGIGKINGHQEWCSIIPIPTIMHETGSIHSQSRGGHESMNLHGGLLFKRTS